jgi:hypothetical protein
MAFSCAYWILADNPLRDRTPAPYPLLDDQFAQFFWSELINWTFIDADGRRGSWKNQ